MTVLPALVGAATSTPWWASSFSIASTWNGSSGQGRVAWKAATRAGADVGGGSGWANSLLKLSPTGGSDQLGGGRAVRVLGPAPERLGDLLGVSLAGAPDRLGDAH